MTSQTLQTQPHRSHHAALPAPAAQPRWWPWALLAVAGAVIASRAPWLPTTPWDHDGANFVRALDTFDLARHSPHAPGYPVYIALARLARAFGAPDAAPLAWPSVAGAAAAAATVAWAVARFANRGTALAAGLAYAALPPLWLGDLAPRPDALAAHVLVAAACLLASQALPAAAVLIALALGVRLSVWPAALVLMLALPRAAWGWLAAGVAAWAVPLAALAGGPFELLRQLTSFGAGHFGQWGNTAATAGLRVDQWAGHLADQGGAVCGGLALVAAVVWVRSRQHATPGWWWAAAVAYAIWIVAGQNPDHPRHVWPLLALVGAACLVAVAVAVGRAAPPLLAAAAALAVVQAAPGISQTHRPAPDAALASWLAARPADSLALAGGSEVGVVRLLAPTIRALRVDKPADVAAALAPGGGWPRTALVSVREGQTAPVGWGEVARFPARPALDAPGLGLRVYARPAPAALALAGATGDCR